MERRWAFWRRVQYGGGVGLAVFLIVGGVFFSLFYEAPTCFDGRHNGTEGGVDCGGSCQQLCPLGLFEPTVQFSKVFRISEDLYSAVAYIENRNPSAGVPQLGYTFSFFDSGGGLITERSGTTFLPPDSVYPIFEGRINMNGKEPVRTFIEIAPIENWQTAAAGREQFIVDSRKLTSADSVPRLRAEITNTALEEERDVEVVATIFDVRGNALTASRSVVPLFGARETKEVVFTWPEPIAKTVRSCEVPSDVVVAVDLSGSMNNDGGIPPEPITSVLQAASSFVSRLRVGDQSSVVTFATDSTLRQTLKSNHTDTRKILQGLAISPSEERGLTNTGDAVRDALAELTSSRHNENARKVLVLITDGKANAPGAEAEEYAVSAAEEAKAKGVTIFTIGLGSEANIEVLRRIASSPSQHFSVASRAGLDGIYRSISTSLCEEGAAVIDVIIKHRSSMTGG